MSDLDTIIIAYIGRSQLANYHFKPTTDFQLCKKALKDLMLEIAETHSIDDQTINLASFVAEVKAL